DVAGVSAVETEPPDLVGLPWLRDVANASVFGALLTGTGERQPSVYAQVLICGQTRGLVVRQAEHPMLLRHADVPTPTTAARLAHGEAGQAGRLVSPLDLVGLGLPGAVAPGALVNKAGLTLDGNHSGTPIVQARWTSIATAL